MNSEQLALQIKLDAWQMAYKAKASHMGGNFSVADVIAVLYSDVLNIDPKNPYTNDRDRVVLSKGHCCAVMYATLAELGFFPRKELLTFGANDSLLSCHISYKVPGVELSSGSLGHGAAVAAGMALNGKIKNLPYHVYAICGDGEMDEGSIWEMIMFAGQHRLDNFTIVVDCNQIQAMGNTKDIIDLRLLSDKLILFGWNTIDVNGHDHDELREAFRADSNGKPKAIISHTVKGHGVSFMEHSLWWHYQIPFSHYYQEAIDELMTTASKSGYKLNVLMNSDERAEVGQENTVVRENFKKVEVKA